MADLIAARARLDELERRAKRDCAHENWACGCLGTPPIPAELVEVLRMAGLGGEAAQDEVSCKERIGVWSSEAEVMGNPYPFLHLPTEIPATLRAVGAVLTLMEENGR